MKKPNRRKFVQTSLKVAALTTIGSAYAFETVGCSTPKESNSPVALEFSQVKLSYEYAALEPSIDALTMDVHYNKHHAAYVKNVNDAIAAEKIPYTSINDFFANISKLSTKARNNGGGAWNHNQYWEVMKPGGENPSGKIADALNSAFGSLEKFKEQFTSAAMTRFGSGWAWLVNDKGSLKVGSTPNQDNPLMDVSDLKGIPLLGIDVWEHAYYLKYQNKRNEYIANWWNVVNWHVVTKRLG